MASRDDAPHDRSASWRDPSRPHAPRTLFLAVAGALIGLILAGYGLFTAKGTTTLIVPADAVALVNQQPISRVDYIAALQSAYATDFTAATPAQRRTVLDGMIREELFVQRGKELDLASVDTDVRTALVNAVEQQAAIDAVTEKPTEAKLRAWYDAHREAYASEGAMIVRDLVFADLGSANSAAEAIKGSQSPDAALKAFGGHDSGKVDGEEFYFAAKLHLGDPLFAAARSLATGGVSAPIQADGSTHVLAMIRNTPPEPFSFEAARARVLDDYRRAAVGRLQASEEGFLRKRANILIAKDLR